MASINIGCLRERHNPYIIIWNRFSSITKGSKNVSKIHKLTEFSGLSDKFQIRALMIKSEMKLISVMQTCLHMHIQDMNYSRYALIIRGCIHS